MEPPTVVLGAPGGRVERWEASVRASVDGVSEEGRVHVSGFPATVSAGPVRLSVEVGPSGPGQLVLRSSVANRGDRPALLRVATPAGLVRWSLDGGAPGRLRVLQNGWQSWSPAGSRAIGDRTVMSWFRPFRRTLWDSADADPPGRHRSEMFTVLHDPEGGGAVVVGFLGAARAFGAIHVTRRGGGGSVGGDPPRSGPDWPRVEATLRMDRVPLGPGETRALEEVYVAVGNDPHALFRRYLEVLARGSGARVPAIRGPEPSNLRSSDRSGTAPNSPHYRQPETREFGAVEGPRPVAGWCSWYQYFNRVTEEDLRKNLRLMAKRFPPTEGVQRLFQLDDGYQRAVGDWLETNAKFPSGLKALAAEIRGAGFTPGLWTAPFLATRNSRLWKEHPDWLLRGIEGARRAAYNPFWHPRPACALDTTRPEFLEHLKRVYGTLTEWGFTYHKIDFLYAGALHGRRHDPSATRAEALRRGLEAIREGIGPDALLLGCGCPLGPAIGVVDGMRIGCDVAPSWETPWSRLFGPGAPSARGGIQNTLARAPLHRVLWLNDPDCAMLRPARTKLSPAEREALALACAAGGGIFLVSDDLSLYGEGEWGRLRELLALFTELEAAGAEARCPDLFQTDAPSTLERTRPPTQPRSHLETRGSRAEPGAEQGPTTRSAGTAQHGSRGQGGGVRLVFPGGPRPARGVSVTRF